MSDPKKDVVVFINAIRPATFSALEELKVRTGKTIRPVVLVDSGIQESITTRNGQHAHKDKVEVVSADFDSPASVRDALRPFADNIFAVTSHYENSIFELKKLLPYLPYLPTPSEKTLNWSTEKKFMRQILGAYDRTLVPGYIEAPDSTPATIKNIEKNLSYPVVVKPSGLEGSLLVSLVANRVQLKQTLDHTFREIQKGYDTWIKRQKPLVLVEEFMDGDMYSVDTYVGTHGVYRHTPLVKVVTGRKAGFEDFFGYAQLAPAGLSDEEVANAHEAAEKACRALGLRSITAHTELMRTIEGWKIIEVGPRVGGYRHEIYSLSYGINHIANDFLNRAGESVKIPTAVKKYTAYIKLYAKEEGYLKTCVGVDHISKLKSFVSIKQDVKIGEFTFFAKNNGDPVYEVLLSHKDQDKLNEDITYLEESVSFIVTKTR